MSSRPIHSSRGPLVVLLVGLLAVLLGAASPLHPAMANELIHSLGPGDARLIWNGGFRTCEGATLMLNAQGDCTTGYCVRHDFLTPPDGGAFAECYSGDYEICAFVIDLSSDGQVSYEGQTLQLLVWDDAGGEPGSVLCITTGVQPEGIGIWPEITRHEFEIPGGCCTTGSWWAGMRSEWAATGSPCYWYYGAVPPGGPGCSRLRVPPGIGYPEGWQPVWLIFGEPCPAMGVGVLVNPCPPTPAERTSWGRVKALYP